MTNDKLHAAMARHVDAGELPGLVTLIARGDEVQVDAIGMQTVGGTQPMRRDTIFRIASITKPIAAAATMMRSTTASCGSTTRSSAGCPNWPTAGC